MYIKIDNLSDDYRHTCYSEVLYVEDDPIDKRLLHIAPHRSAAFSKSKESIGRPSIHY